MMESFGLAAVDKGERLGTAFLAGVLRGRFGQKFGVLGSEKITWDLVCGATLTTLAAALSIASDGKSPWAHHLDGIGQAALDSWASVQATQLAVARSGRPKPVMLDAKKTKAQGIGADGQPYLTATEIARFAGVGR